MTSFYSFNDLCEQLKRSESGTIVNPKPTSNNETRKRVIDVTVNSSRTMFLFDKPTVVCDRKGFEVKAKSLIAEGCIINIMTITDSIESDNSLGNYLKNLK